MLPPLWVNEQNAYYYRLRFLNERQRSLIRLFFFSFHTKLALYLSQTVDPSCDTSVFQTRNPTDQDTRAYDQGLLFSAVLESHRN